MFVYGTARREVSGEKFLEAGSLFDYLLGSFDDIEVCVCVGVCVLWCVYVCVCVGVCERKRERERDKEVFYSIIC